MTSKAGGRGLKAAENDLIHCPICFDVFDDPRSMPCLHTYCYKCLGRLCVDKIPGSDSVNCPICRKGCNIPSAGVAGFAHNFFIQRMVDDSRPDASQESAVVCEVCADENQTAAATKYCIDCCLRLCETCNKHHSRMKRGNHRLGEIGAESEFAPVQLASSYCMEHANEMLLLYCFDCSCNICVSCVGERHPKHKLQRIETVAANFKSQISADLVAVKKRLDEITQQNEHQKTALKDFCDRMTSIVNAVDKQCRDAISYFETVINDEKQKILLDLQLTKEKALKQFTEIEERTGLSLVSMKSFINYAEELKNKGKPYDLTRAGNDVHNRASEIISEHPQAPVYNRLSVEFRAQNVPKVLTAVTKRSIVGCLVKTDDNTDEGIMNRVVPLKPVVVQQFSAYQPSVTLVIAASEGRKGCVIGLTVHGDELFKVRLEPKGLIEVYNATTFTFKRNIKVKELEERRRKGEVAGLTSCASNNCLYVSYGGYLGDGYITRVDLTGDNKVFKWNIKDSYGPRGLSVNSEHNLMVACCSSSHWITDKLIEFTTRGQLVREILLLDDVVNPLHAIQLNSSQFLVSHDSSGGVDSQQRVCVVDANGRVLLSYGNKRGSETGQLNWPQHLAVDRNGFIFVADKDNDRIVVLDSALKWSCDLQVDGDGVKRPCALYLDDRRNLLLVGEWNDDDSRVVAVTV